MSVGLNLCRSSDLPEDVHGLGSVRERDRRSGAEFEISGYLHDPYRVYVVSGVEGERRGDTHLGGPDVQTTQERQDINFSTDKSYCRRRLVGSRGGSVSCLHVGDGSGHTCRRWCMIVRCVDLAATTNERRCREFVGAICN